MSQPLESQTHCIQQVVRLATHKLCTDEKDCPFQFFCGFSCLLYEIPNWTNGLWYVMARLNTNYRIGQADSSTLWHFHDLFTCCTNYRTGQMESSTLWHFYGLLYELPNRPDGLPPSGTFTACSIAKHQIGQTDFHPLTLDGSTIRNQLGLGGDHRHGLYTTKVSADVWSTRLVSLIYRHHSDSCFKAIGRRGPVGMMIRL